MLSLSYSYSLIICLIVVCVTLSDGGKRPHGFLSHQSLVPPLSGPPRAATAAAMFLGFSEYSRGGYHRRLIITPESMVPPLLFSTTGMSFG